MSTKLLNDVASILAEVGVTYQQAEEIAAVLNTFFLEGAEEQEFVDKASNAPSGGECGC
jgi:hypothetical protein